jgi:hypothetical protein
MPSFNPETEYDITSDSIRLRDFHDYPEEFVTRPPYQRKNVWSRKKQQALLDSLFRGYYVPRIVIRRVRLSEEETVKEVIDGQQRITTAQTFFADELKLPSSLEDVRRSLPGSTYSELSSEVRRFVDRLSYDADIVLQIDDPFEERHQQIATEIFWRLQQGESLNYMEVAHARLSSTARNFVVKYADDQTFDYDAYRPVSENPTKHLFFSTIRRKNNRMQHMALLTRFLILEEADGPADIKQTDVQAYIDQHQVEGGIGSEAFEKTDVAQDTLDNMRSFYDVFADDPLRAEGEGIPILKVEYFIISLYLLLRHLRAHYAFGETERMLFRDFAYDFYDRWRNGEEEDIQIFQNKRQQSAGEIATRQRIIRQHFFEYVQRQGHEMVTKDEKRRFDEAERIRIYRRDSGLCQLCLDEGKPEAEAEVLWEEFEADHVTPHAEGGPTVVENGQVLCRYHNRRKGAQVAEPVSPGADVRSTANAPSSSRSSTSRKTSESKGLSTRYWLTPVAERGSLSPQEVVVQTVGNGAFGFSSDAIQKMRPRPGDRLSFYGSRTGIVADATVAGRSHHAEDPSAELQIPDADNYPYIVDLENASLYDEPIEVTEGIRRRLEAFEESDASEGWGWFVLTVRQLSRKDFRILTGRA